MLETEKQQFLIDHLAQSAGAFETVIAAVDPKHWTVHPDPNRWSIAEIAEHVLIIDGNVARFTSKLAEWPEEPYDSDQNARKDELILKVAERPNPPIEAPPHVRPTGKLATVADFSPAFRTSQETMTRVALENRELLRGALPRASDT